MKELEIIKNEKNKPKAVYRKQNELSGRNTAQLAKVDRFFQTDISTIRPSSFLDVFKHETPTIAAIKRQRDEFSAEIVVVNLVSEINNLVSTKEKLTDEQIQLIADTILCEYPTFSITDLKLCFRMGVRGKFKKIYERIGVDSVEHWLTSYTDQRLEAAAQEAQKKSNQEKAEKTSTEGAKMLVEKLKKVVSTTEETKKSNFQYQSVEKYCLANDINYENYINAHKKVWAYEFELMDNPELSEDFFFKYCEGQLLNSINYKK